MDPDSIRARTDIPFLKKHQDQHSSELKKMVSTKSKPLRKTKPRSKVEGFFKSDVQSAFSQTTVKREVVRVKSGQFPT